MRRHAKASSAATTHGIGSSRGLLGRALATRGFSSDARGSGAPTIGLRAHLGAALAVMALVLAFAAAPALAANPPAVRVGVTIPSDSALTFATLGATVNPEGQATTYFFEYGKTDAYGDSAPFGGTSAGSGTADVPVSRKVSELELNSTYHYRLVATNASGTTKGPDFTFQTGPNLGNGMHYELVSPADTNGSPTMPKDMSPDGTRVNMSSGTQGFGDAQSQHGLTDTYLATRTSTGWVTTGMNPPQNPGLDVALGRTLDTNADLSTQMAVTATQNQFQGGAATLRLMRPGDLNFAAFPEYRDLSGESAGSENVMFNYGGASDDLKHVFFYTTRDTYLLPGETKSTGLTPSTTGHLYEMTLDPPALRSPILDNSGNNLAPICMASSPGGFGVNGATNGRAESSISADGSKVFFGAQPGTPVSSCAEIPARLYARVNGTETVEISASECQPACASPLSSAASGSVSDDGSKVLFSTVQQLLNVDTDATRDLYLYNFAKPSGQHLSLVSKGEVTPGNGAQVKNVLHMSDDGTRIYFVAAGVLTTGKNNFGQAALAGANNLYLYEPGTDKTVFVTRLDASDSGLWGEGSSFDNQFSDATGRYMLMSVKTQIGPGDTDSVTDLYRYDAQAGQLLRITPGNTADAVGGVAAKNGGFASPPSLSISTDGSTIAFVTAAALQVNDTNGLTDTYLWHDGAISLISGGNAPRGASGTRVSASGDEVAFSTAVALLPKDANSNVSTYVARTGADVEPPIVTPPPPCASSELCRGSTPPAPAKPTPVTTGSGPGNEATPPPAKNPHKKKHHKKKHHKKTHRAHKHSTHRAG